MPGEYREFWVKVFISYRRDDSQVESTSIYRELSRAFGEKNVFFDVDNIPVGVNFKAYLEDAVTECGLMLVIIGKHWANLEDDAGQPRLEDPRDFVRIEIESALAQGLTVVPLLVNGAKMPKASQLPRSLQDIVYLNAAELSWGRDFDGHIQRLLRDIDRIRTVAPQEAPPLEPCDRVQMTEVATLENDAQKTGTLTFSNGDQYEGDVADGQPHGQGIKYHSSGSRYEGEFAHGLMHGQGVYHFFDGGRYEGQFVDGQEHGQGTLYHVDGDRYEGQFAKGLEHGKGIFKYADGDRYEGQFVDGQAHGYGTYYYGNRDRWTDGELGRYEGQFVEGQEHGQGIFYGTDGGRYEGTFVDGSRDGHGIYYYADGRHEYQTWVRGFLKSRMS